MSAMSSQLQKPSGLRSQVFGETAFVSAKRAAPVQKRQQLQVRGAKESQGLELMLCERGISHRPASDTEEQLLCDNKVREEDRLPQQLFTCLMARLGCRW